MVRRLACETGLPLPHIADMRAKRYIIPSPRAGVDRKLFPDRRPTPCQDP